MTKVLTLTDGTQYNLSDESTYTNMAMKVNAFAVLDVIAPKFVPENMVRIMIDETVYTNIIPMALKAEKVSDGVVFRVECRDMTQEELNTAMIEELQDAVIEMVIDGEGDIDPNEEAE